jgi:hypothetical protein
MNEWDQIGEERHLVVTHGPRLSMRLALMQGFFDQIFDSHGELIEHGVSIEASP